MKLGRLKIFRPAGLTKCSNAIFNHQYQDVALSSHSKHQSNLNELIDIYMIGISTPNKAIYEIINNIISRRFKLLR